LAKKNNEKFVVKGTGKALRQFIYSEDLAKLIMWTLEKYDKKDSIILSVDQKDEFSIEKIGKLIAKNFDYENNIIFDSNFSDGQYKKTADNSKLMKLIKNFNFTSIEKGLKETINWFNINFDKCRK
jgi:GDP-L-fucose synthase